MTHQTDAKVRDLTRAFLRALREVTAAEVDPNQALWDALEMAQDAIETERERDPAWDRFGDEETAP
jgi:hypothetical protein